MQAIQYLLHFGPFCGIMKGMTSDTKFQVGDRVNKIKGYRFPGIVVSVFPTKDGNIRLVVEMDEFGLLHIFNESQLLKL